MKKALSLLFFIALFLLPVSADTPPQAPPEFYFARMMYSGGRGGRFGFRSAPLENFTCADLARGEGGFGGGWMTDYPAADCKFMWGVERLTGIHVYKEKPVTISIMDPKVFEYPYLYIVEPGQMYLSDEEAVKLREYLQRGGFLHIDDFWGLEEAANLIEQMEKVFPDRAVQPVPLTHEIFHTFFDVDTVMQIPNVGNGCNGGPTWERSSDTRPRVLGISDDNQRLMVMITYNSDLGDAWEWMDRPCYPEMYSGQAYRMGINFIIYAMTH